MTRTRTASLEALDQHFVETVSTLQTGRSKTSVDDGRLLGLFDSQAGSRHLDLMARQLGKRGVGYYSIGSSGHESNATVAAALRPTDPALLHYRSGAFYIERARQLPNQHPLGDILHGIVASIDDPISGGRHKVIGNPDLAVIPQTSTIASHLPRAVGIAFSIGRAARLGLETQWPSTSVVVCSFGDASANHSTATGAINAALHSSYQRVAMPLLFVCEDNDIGISVPTPAGWIRHTYEDRPGLRYYNANGSDTLGCLETAAAATTWVRENRSPAFLHLHMVRLMGHAGSDVESSYRARTEIVAEYARDPLLSTARALAENRICKPSEILDRYEAKRAEVAELTEHVLTRPRLTSSAAVMAPIGATNPTAVADRVRIAPAPAPDQQIPKHDRPLTLAQSINHALSDELASDPRVLVFGEDVARKGGIYGVTRGLRKAFGGQRVFDTLLDEQSVLGTALGAGISGMVPIPEIQYLAYLHNAADQLRGEASTIGFFSNSRYRNPMVVRIAGYAYQKGFGGHFHNDNSVAALRDIPGVVVATPSRPDDAAAMLRTCVSAAAVDGRVCVFLEPIALYHTRDLYEPDDSRWLAAYPDFTDDPAAHVPIGAARLHGSGSDLTIVTFGNGLPMSLRVARSLADRGIGTRVLDLRWLVPLPEDDLLASAKATGRVLVVDETRRSGGVSESVVTALVDHGFTGPVARVTSKDSFIPLGDASRHVLLEETTIETAALELIYR